MKRHKAFLIVLFVSIAPASGGAAPREWGLPVPAPYQLVSVETRIDDIYYDSGNEFAPMRIVVDLGEAAGSPAAFEELREWTVLDASGWAHARLVDIEKRCEYLCGAEEESESCYYVAVIERAGDAQDSLPLAAIPGALELTDYEPLQGRPLDSTPLQPGAEPAGLFEREKYRVTEVDGDSLTLAFHWAGASEEHVAETPVRNCTAREYGLFGLTETACSGLNILSGGVAPLIVSFPDYNVAKATPLASFAFGGSRYYVIRYGAKAQDIIGLVVAAPSGWRGLFQGRNHALLC